MDLKMQWTAFGLVAVGLMVAVGIGMARNPEMDQVSVSLTDFRAVNQERLGFAIVMDHFVERSHEMSHQWTWQERRGHQIVTAHWVKRARGVAQEALGWRIAAAHLMARAHGAGQEALGWRTAAAHAWDRVRGLDQERQGLDDMAIRAAEG